MQTQDRHNENACIPLGRRRGFFDLALSSLDLVGPGPESVGAARPGDYPSPPMSGSPPLPPKPSQEAAERGRGPYSYAPLATTHDVYRGIPSTTGEGRVQVGGTMALSRPPHFGEEQPRDTPHYPFARPEAAGSRPMLYQPQHAPVVNPPSYMSPTGPPPIGPGPGILSHSYVGAGPPAPSGSPAPNSPKAQRKTKGHVASACVPCKRAHLRCDAQRPCARCINNGKEEMCVDVQHKKRGRPRLRDDREHARSSQAPESMMRRPMSYLGATGPPMGMPFDDALRRTQSYRVLKSQPTESAGPFATRASMSHAPPLSIATTRIPEPAAYLTMELEIAKASSTFANALGRAGVDGLRLIDLVVPADKQKCAHYQRQFQDEQRMRDPTYLPPIFDKQETERVMQLLGFTLEEMSRYNLDRQEFLAFVGHDGQSRPMPVRLGLAKQDSIYFIVIALNLAPRPFHPPPTPSPSLRDAGYSYQSMPQPYSQPTPVSATFDHRHVGGYGPRPSGPQPPMGLNPSPGALSSYSASPNRPEYTGYPPHHVPRSELSHPPPVSQSPGYQLPPILGDQSRGPPTRPDLSYPPREDRSRVDIGGLIDHPDKPLNK